MSLFIKQTVCLPRTLATVWVCGIAMQSKSNSSDSRRPLCSISQEASWRPVALFGGAITANIPERFVDVSDFRPVPDHQEVWADGATDQSVVVEVMERSNVPDAEAGRFVFEDLACANEAIRHNIAVIRQLGDSEIQNLPAGTYASLVIGTQEASKSREGPECSNRLHVLLSVIRLPQHGSDLLVTVNAPTFISPSSSAAQHAYIQGLQPAAEAQAAAVMQGLLSSLVIADQGLFR